MALAQEMDVAFATFPAQEEGGHTGKLVIKEVWQMAPPISANSDISGGLPCYAPGCGCVAKGFASLLDHLRKYHQVLMSDLRGTYFHAMASMELAQKQRSLYHKKKGQPCPPPRNQRTKKVKGAGVCAMNVKQAGRTAHSYCTLQTNCVVMALSGLQLLPLCAMVSCGVACHPTLHARTCKKKVVK